MYSRNRKKMKLFPRVSWLFIAVFSVSTISAYMLTRSILPYRIEVTKVLNAPQNVPYFYYDFQHDGYSESVQAWYNPDSSYTGIVFYRYNGSVLRQVNLRGKSYINSGIPGLNWSCLADYDSNGTTDMFVFHTWQDTLFLCLIEVNPYPQKKWDVPLVVSRGIRQNWDLYINDVQYVQLSPSQPAYLVFALTSGQSLKPRGIYAVDVRAREIAFKYESGMDITSFQVTDVLPHPGNEVLLSVYTNNSYPPGSPEPNDRYSYFVVLNSHLQPLFKPIALLPAYSFLHAFWAKPIQQVITVVGYNGLEDYSSQFIAWSPDGNRLRHKPLPHYRKIISYYFEKQPYAIYLISNDSSAVYLFNLAFERLNAYYFTGRYGLFAPLNNQFLLFTSRNIAILDSQLQEQARYTFSQPLTELGFALSVYRDNQTVMPEYVLSNGKMALFFTIFREPLYQYRYLVFVGSAVLVMVGLYGVGGILFFLFTIVAYFYHSFKRNPNTSFIISRRGFIVYGRSNLRRFLKLPYKPVINYLEDLQPYMPLIVSQLRNQLSVRKQVTVSAIMNREEEEVEIEITIEPLTILLRPIAYYIEFRENTTYVLSEKLELWGKTLERMVHDMKSPLSSVFHGLKALNYRLKQLNLPETERQLFEENLNAQTQALQKLFKRTQLLLKVTHIIEPNFQRQHIHQIIEKSIDNFKEYFDNGGIHLKLDFDEQVPPFCFDADQMEIVFNTLIENAIDAMEEDGILSITTTFQVHPTEQTSFVEILVGDTGSGIPEPLRPLIFKRRINSQKHKGSGIGLLLVKNIVESHGGQIHFHSASTGTVFAIILPVMQNCEEGHE